MHVNLLQRKVTALEERVTMATERETEMQSTMNKVREREEEERERERRRRGGEKKNNHLLFHCYRARR